MKESPEDERFLQALTSSQAKLLSYISCLLGNVHDANTVLQETNIVLWRKSDEFRDVRNFDAWSREVAYFKTLAFLRDRKRDKLIFSQEVIDAIVAAQDSVDVDERRLALRDCVANLGDSGREMIRKRYTEGKLIADIAKEMERSEGAIKMALKRLRVSLAECVNRRIGPAL